MNDLVSILESLRARPAMYLGAGRASIGYLAAFLNGFELGRKSPDTEAALDAFTDWVCVHFGVSDGPMRWDGLLLRQAGGDEQVALRLFFELLPAYMEDRTALGHAGIHSRFMQCIFGPDPR